MGRRSNGCTLGTQTISFSVSWCSLRKKIASLIDCHSTNTANPAAYKAEGRDFYSEPTKNYVTGSLSVKHTKPTSVNKPVTLRARITEIKGSKITVTCSLYSEGVETATGEVVAFQIR